MLPCFQHEVHKLSSEHVHSVCQQHFALLYQSSMKYCNQIMLTSMSKDPRQCPGLAAKPSKQQACLLHNPLASPSIHWCVIAPIRIIYFCIAEVDNTPIISISELSRLLEQIGDREWEYTWLPTAAVHAVVSCLIATIYRPGGKFKQALAYLSQAQQVIDEEVQLQGIKVSLSVHATAYLIFSKAQIVALSDIHSTFNEQPDSLPAMHLMQHMQFL